MKSDNEEKSGDVKKSGDEKKSDNGKKSGDVKKSDDEKKSMNTYSSKIEASYEKKIFIYAASSRFVVFLMQAVFNYLIKDHKPDVFNPPKFPDVGTADKVVDIFLSGFHRWDSIYMLHIAEYGYTYENSMAFFPMFPMLVRFVGFTLCYPLHSLMTVQHVMMISAFIVNTACFIMAAIYLYRLGRILIGKGSHPWYAAVLFCFNPASIFMSAAYTEASFALWTFAMMYYLELREYTKTTIALALAVATRSNGLPLVLYPAYIAMRLLLADEGESRMTRLLNLSRDWLKLLSVILYGCIPFAFYQYLGFVIYCLSKNLEMPHHIEDYGNRRGYTMPHNPSSPWCFYALPTSYSYIQDTHWNVGFFRYYEVKQLPNFFLALPVIVMSLASIGSYICKCKDALIETNNVRAWLDSKPMMFMPYCLHLLFLVTYGIGTVHIQVLTRMIYSSSPILYFFLARYLGHYLVLKQTSFCFKLLLTYHMVYFVIGTAVFSNFYPWT